MHDLLTDPLIGVRTASGTQRRVTLPGVIAGLLSGDVVDFTGPRAHQADPWHVLLVQLAASVMARQADGVEPPADEAFWRTALLDLAEGQPTAWQLVVDDVTLPAFMQHPLSALQDLDEFKLAGSQPDEIDVLVTSKDHDVKGARARSDDLESWLFALVTVQTTSGYSGRDTYGSIRMNSGTGSRCIVSLVASSDPSRRFIEELGVVRAMRTKALRSAVGYQNKSTALTWLRPWDRSSHQWVVTELEPWFIESVRPIRLRVLESGLCAFGRTTNARQVGPKALENGDVFDPWLPIKEGGKKERSALTVSGSGWTPQRLSDLMLQQSHELTDLQKPRHGMRGSAVLLASVLARGKNPPTAGFHREAVPVPVTVLPLLSCPDGREQLARGAASLRDDASEAQKSLSTALKSLASGGPEKVNQDSNALAAWAAACLESFTRGWSDRYFEALWRLADTPLAAVRADWKAALVADAHRTLREAEGRLPTPSSRRWRGRVAALGLLDGSLRKKGLLPEAAQASAETADPATSGGQP